LIDKERSDYYQNEKKQSFHRFLLNLNGFINNEQGTH